MHRSTLTAVVAAIVSLLAVACSADPDPPPVALTGSLPPTTAQPGSTDAPTTTAPAALDGTGAPASPPVADGPSDASPEVVTFDLPARVSCTGTEAVVTATYTTVDATQVAFLVDQQPVRGGPNPPVSGTTALTLPCDGNVHTVLLVAVGPAGQALATRAVRAGTDDGAG